MKTYFKWGAATLVTLIVLGGAIIASQLGPKASRIATRWSCPCVYVEGRALDYCLEHLPIDVGGLVDVKADTEARTLTSTSFFVFQSRARYVSDAGCVMEN